MYSKINWTSTMLLTPARFRQMETQHDEVIDYWDANSFRLLSSASVVVEVSSTEPAHQDGRMYFNSSSSELSFYVSDGTSWDDITDFLQEVP